VLKRSASGYLVVVSAARTTRAIAGPDGAELVAVADTSVVRAETLAGEHGCSSFPNLQEMLSGADLDAVCVCTPSGMHAEHAIAALEAGKHVVIEKPVAVTLRAADRLLAAQRATGKKRRSPASIASMRPRSPSTMP
jgi:UDP-N-acetyl-2-amino-2-deoxyglucuronate dehydrogenase